MIATLVILLVLFICWSPFFRTLFFKIHDTGELLATFIFAGFITVAIIICRLPKKIG